MSMFHAESGAFQDHDEIRQALDNHHNHQAGLGLADGEYVRSELFAADDLRALLAHPDIAGVRVYHARRWENENGEPTEEGVGKSTPRLVMVGVDAVGRKLMNPDESDAPKFLAFNTPLCPPTCPIE